MIPGTPPISHFALRHIVQLLQLVTRVLCIRTDTPTFKCSRMPAIVNKNWPVDRITKSTLDSFWVHSGATWNVNPISNLGLQGDQFPMGRTSAQ